MFSIPARCDSAYLIGRDGHPLLIQV